MKYQKLIPCNCPVCKNSQNPYAYDFNELMERLAHKKLTIDCRKPPYYEVQVFSLIDNSIDIQKLISQLQEDNNKELNFESNINQLIVQIVKEGNISGDFMAGDRNTKQTHSGSGDNVAGDKNVNQSRNIDISGNAQVAASGAGAFSQGDNQGTIANEINENNSPPQQESKLAQRLAIAAAIATIIALFFNGIFNDEVKQWFDNLFDKDTPSLSEPK